MKQKKINGRDDILREHAEIKAVDSINGIDETRIEGQPNADRLEGFSLTGEFVANLKDKRFTIVSKPEYRTVKDFNDPNVLKQKLLLRIELAEGKQIVEYMPNTTSWKLIANECGTIFANWVGYSGEFYTAKQMIGKELKDVIYIKPKLAGV